MGMFGAFFETCYSPSLHAYLFGQGPGLLLKNALCLEHTIHNRSRRVTFFLSSEPLHTRCVRFHECFPMSLCAF